MTQSQDEDEHSIEMHLPLVRKIFEGSVGRPLRAWLQQELT